jgi:hypothetical protein
MKRTSVILFISLLLALFVQPIVAQSPACQVGKQAAAVGFWAWHANSRVKVFIVSRDFGQNEIEPLFTPFQNWNDVAKQTGSHVTFEFAGVTHEQQLCENCLTLLRGDVFNKKTRHATELRAFSAESNQIITYASIVVDSGLTNFRAVLDAVAHELGHSFSLLDCRKCKPRTTLMSQFAALNVPNDLQHPTTCDVEQVRKAYQMLTTQVGPAPISRASVDPGEEPVEDDTPVIVPNP